MRPKLTLKLVLSLFFTAILNKGVNAQITLLQDYQNNYSAPIGTFQGIKFREGGFSSIFPIPNTNGKEFWVISDRGMNVDAANANPTGCKPTYDKIFGFPNYAPKIFRIKINADSVQILKTIPIRRPNGTTATGIMNPTGFGSTAAEIASTDTVMNCLNFSLKTAPKDIWGLDCEGIVVDKDGNFWLSEEGGPTVWKVDPTGIVLKRYTPFANKVGAQSIDVMIDSCFGYRKNNRGFEGLSIAPNGKIYALIQSPLLYPTQSIGEGTRINRLLEIDPTTNSTKMYVYLNEGIIGASGSNQIRLSDWKIGDMAAINDSTFLVIEHAVRGTSDRKNIFTININGATAVNSGLYSGKTLEALVDSTGLAANGIKPVKKKLFMDMLAKGWPTALDKPEGIAIINDSTIAISNDNDFQQVSLPQDGIAVPTTNLCHVLVYGLKGTNKLNNYKVGAYNPLTQSGPSTSQSPYLGPITPGLKATAILSVGDSINGYKMCGIPDGLGAYDNNDGTFTLLMNHEFGNTVGVTRAHGSKGSFVSKWVINKSDLKVLSGGDLIKNVNLWDTASKSYKTYNLSNPSTLAAFGRFCSADLPSVSAFFNSSNGLGTKERIFMNGEEINDESRAMAHIVTGTNAGTSYELPALGKAAWENAVANPGSGDKTVVALTNDGTDGQVYFYIGTKTNSGNEIEKAGLTKGKPYGVSVTGFAAERTSSTSNIAVPTPGTRFSLVDLGSVENMTGAAFNSKSNTLGVTKFSRPEDGAWDPSHPDDFYFVTTDQLDQVKDGVGSQIGRSRLWRLHFDDITKPELGGTIEAVLDGSEGQVMLDNITIDKFGHILLQEDVGNSAHNGKIWQYTIATDQLKMIAKHDISRFGDIGVAATAPFNLDEESSGIIDVQDILGAGMFLTSDQAHYATNTELVEGGQLMAIFNPDTYNSFKGAGPSTAQIPYVEPVATGVKTTSILSVGDSISGYRMVGIPDGLGAFDNNNGTFTLVMNHELGNTVGIARAHGSKGSFVSKWVINKADLKVLSGSDLMKNVNLWDTASKSYKTYNLSNPSVLAAFSRFCSADLPPVSAFYNSSTGLGTQERIFMNGEENNDESRAMAHIITGTNAGTSYELPALGKAAWENAIASPASGNKTVVALTNDGTDGQVYFYIGTKTNSGTEIDKAGLTKGKPWGVSVAGFAAERTSSTSNITIPEPGTRFSLVDLGSVENITGASFNTKSNTAGVTKFSRPEDGAWDPSNPNDFYFNTTDQIDQVKDGVGTQVGRSRVWRLRFDDITKPELGGTIEAVLDGSEGQVMLDNMTIDKFGHILLQEDVGNSSHNGKIWQYTIATDQLKMIAKHDVTKFGDIGIAATTPFNVDEESSGIIDASEILGAGMFLMVDQTHYSIPGELAEGGQLLTLFNPETYNNANGANISSSATPYVLPVAVGVKTNAILTVGDAVNNYRMVGIPDGLGAYDNNNGTFTLLMNHELGNTLGTSRAHGSKGSFVSKWIIDKNNLKVLSGGDLIKNVKLWNGTGYTTYNSSNPSTSAAFTRFCSADLPPLSAFFNSATGLGTSERLFMNGEEANDESRAFAHIATGPNAGTTYELPFLGKAAWENAIASPASGNKTVVALTNDGTDGQVYFYIGTKTNTGTEVDKAGLTNGHPWGVVVSGFAAERTSSTSNIALPSAGTRFSLTDLGSVENMTGAAFNTASNTAGVTKFSRPEDGAWDPSHPNDFYFNTTDQIDQVKDGIGTQVGRSRVWRLRFDDITKPELGGTIEAVLDGSEGQVMLDNMTIDKFGHILLQEDVGNSVHNGKLWQYTIATDQLKMIAKHDSKRFGDLYEPATAPFNVDEESSGIIDMQDILGAGMFMFVNQAHYAIAGELAEGGQLLTLYNPDTYNSNPEISVKGNKVDILKGDLTPSVTDNTDFGTIDTKSTINKTFVVKNAGPGDLMINNLNLSGSNASEYAIVSTPSFPLTLKVTDSLVITIKFAPLADGIRKAVLTIENNDADENNFEFAIQGTAVSSEINLQGNTVNIFNGDLTPGTANNTDFGTVNTGSNASKPFVIQNTGLGTLTVTNIAISGANVSEFVLLGSPSFPLTIAPSGSQTFNVQFTPSAPGLRTALVTINNNDNDEAVYTFGIQGNGKSSTAINGLQVNQEVMIMPNPFEVSASLKLALKSNSNVSIEVYNLLGEKVEVLVNDALQTGNYNYQIGNGTSNYPAGIYFVKVVIDGKMSTIKLIKNN